MSFFPSSVPTALQLLDARNNKSVTLSSDINDVITTIPVADTSNIPTAGYLTFEDGSNEIIQYTGVTPTSITGCTRGADGSTASAHSDNGTIGMWGNAEYHNILADEIIAIAQNLQDRIGGHATQILAQNGTVASPSYSFGSDQNTGLYGAAPDQIGFALGGSNAGILGIFGGVTQFQFRDGTVGAPAISFVNDTDSGFYVGGSNFITISLGGSNAMSFAGIGAGAGFLPGINDTYALGSTSLGWTLLYMMGGSVSAPSYTFRNDPDTGIYLIGANTMGFTQGGTLRFTVGGTNISGTHLTPNVDISQDLGGASLFWRNCYLYTILSGDGSAVSPSYTFNSDSNTGFYSAGANTIGVSCGGVNVGTFSSAGLSGSFNFADGSAASPSFNFSADTNTGIYRVGADQIGFAVGGGNGGILGIFGAATQFQGRDGAAATPYWTFVNDPDTGIYSGGANSLNFAVGGSLAWNINSIGNLQGFLSDSKVYAASGAVGTPSYSFTSDSNNGMYLFGTDSIAFSTSSTLALVITSGQRTQFTDGSAALPSLSFISDTDTGIYRIGANNIGFSVGSTLVLDLRTTELKSGLSINPFTAASSNLGNATDYWNDVSYKTLTDRGCLPWCDEGVELIDGSKVSDLEAICAIKKHATQKTVHGLPKLDYRTFPKKAYRPADVNGKLIARDKNDEPVKGQDGIEMTMMFGVMLGAFKELKKENDSLKERLAVLEA